jgi:hypothetical protein
LSTNSPSNILRGIVYMTYTNSQFYELTITTTSILLLKGTSV